MIERVRHARGRPRRFWPVAKHTPESCLDSGIAVSKICPNQQTAIDSAPWHYSRLESIGQTPALALINAGGQPRRSLKYGNRVLARSKMRAEGHLANILVGGDA